MAYNFTVESSTLIVTLDTQSGAYEPQILTLKAPSIELGITLNLKDFGVFLKSFQFNDIGLIDGVAPTDLADAVTKLNTLTANFSWGGTAPEIFTQYVDERGSVLNATTSVLSASDLSTAYPNAKDGFSVIAPNVIGGGKYYIKAGAGWVYQQILAVV